METKAGLESHLGYWLRHVSNHVSGEFARALQTKQVSVAEWVVLSSIHARPDVTSGELAVDLNLTRGAVSKIVDKLEARDWITRVAKREDSRVQLLRLTRAGSRVLPRLAEIADENDRKFFAVLDDEESATLRRLLRKLSEFHRMKGAPIE